MDCRFFVVYFWFEVDVEVCRMFVGVEVRRTSSACNTACSVERGCEDPAIEVQMQDIPNVWASPHDNSGNQTKLSADATAAHQLSDILARTAHKFLPTFFIIKCRRLRTTSLSR